MLESLHVKNLALIEEAEVEFGSRLNILTGETGAGKSIIIGSINLALGAKASPELIRSGEESAYVELVFGIEEDTKEKLQAAKIDLEGDLLVLSRKISKKRSICRVNGEMATIADIRKIASILIDIHGQHEHQSLLYKNKQLEIVDYFARIKAEPIKKKIKDNYGKYCSVIRKLEETGMSEEERNRQISFLEYEKNEIEEAALKEGEEETVELEYRRLANSGTIREGLLQAGQLLCDENSYEGRQEGGAVWKIGKAVSLLTKASEQDKEIGNFLEEIRTAEDLLSGVCREMANYLEMFAFDEEALQKLSDRLDVIHRLKAKYGSSIAEILTYKEKAEKKLLLLENQEEYRKKCLAEKKQIEIELENDSEKLSIIRKKQAKLLEKKMKEALLDLNFMDVQFEIAFAKKNHLSEDGLDEVEFQISTNPGEAVRPLGKIASGGELSRIMLAIKSVLAGQDSIETMVFDEIDTGISGRTAQMVSEKLSVLSSGHQIICITHLPQIAAMADRHFQIEKMNRDNRTVTKIKRLSENESVDELARILGGAEITGAVRKNAEEMRQLASQLKKK